MRKMISDSNTILLLLLAICGALIHILLNGQYGFHRDELDIIMNARQLDWGYVAPAYVMLTAAGCAWCLNELAKRSEMLRRAGTGLLYALVAVGGMAGILLIKPVAPINSALWKITSKLNRCGKKSI